MKTFLSLILIFAIAAITANSQNFNNSTKEYTLVSQTEAKAETSANCVAV